MANITQTMNTTEVEYMSMYEKPKLQKCRPKGTRTFTDEEKQEEGEKQTCDVIIIATGITCFTIDYIKNKFVKQKSRLEGNTVLM